MSGFNNSKQALRGSLGFTFIEAIVVMAVFAILAGASFPIYKIIQEKNNLNIARNVLVTATRRAQTLSVANKEDAVWGVHIEQGSVVVFKGLDYTARDISKDEAFSISQQIVPSGPADIIFSKLFGLPQTTGTIILSNNNETREIILNGKGILAY